MPRNPSQSAKSQPRRGVKRGLTPTSDPNTASDDDHKPKKTKSGKAKPRPWSGEELASLLQIALSVGPSKANFEGKVPGRTGEHMSVVPFLYKALREKGDKKKA